MTPRPPAKPRAGGGSRPAAPARPGTRERRRNGALLGAMVSSIALVGVLFVGPFPVRTWWSQHTEAERLQQQIDVLHKANGKLSTRSRELDDPATIAALARRDYGMVHKGESAYAILPPPVPANRLPAVWPFVPLTDSSSGTAP